MTVGRWKHVETLLMQSYSEFTRRKGSNRPQTTEAPKRLVTLYQSWNKPKKIEALRASNKLHRLPVINLSFDFFRKG
jgi:DTW domain-containing protein YfiP